MKRIRVTSETHRDVRRIGFTLIELLVVVTVMLILVTMTVVAIDFSFTSERIRSGARQMQSALEGARDRAIFAREARGLRLLVDPTEPRMVSTMIYIGASKNWSEGKIQLQRVDDAAPSGVADSAEVKIVLGDAGCGWSTLKDRGFMGVFEDLNLNGNLDAGEDLNGNGLLDLDAPRIKIPADDNGTWYTVLTTRLSATSQVLELITPYRDPGTTPPTEVVAFQGGGPNTYILELPPRILADAHPILLPEGVVIDLEGSQVPAAWRPGTPPPGAPPYTMPIETQYSMPYSSHMDIMFSPRGVVTGPLAAFGLLHLYLAEKKDVVFAQDQGVMVPPVTGTLTRRPPRFGTNPALVPGADQFGPEDQIGQRLLVSVFTQTGKVSVHQVNTVDSDSDGYADSPFSFATQGEAQSQ